MPESELPNLFTLTWTFGFELTELNPLDEFDPEFDPEGLGERELLRFEELEEFEEFELFNPAEFIARSPVSTANVGGAPGAGEPIYSAGGAF